MIQHSFESWTVITHCLEHEAPFFVSSLCDRKSGLVPECRADAFVDTKTWVCHDTHGRYIESLV